MTNGERLRQRRLQYGHAAGLEHGYNAKTIRDALGVSQSQYSLYEGDNRRVPLARMLALCTFYGVTLERGFPEYRATAAEKKHAADTSHYMRKANV